MLKKAEYSIAAAEAITYEDGKFWYVSYWDNIICCMDGKTYETTLLCKVDENIKEGLFSQAVSYKNKIYFIPKLANAITVYDKEKKSTYKLDFLKGNEVIVGCKFYTSIIDGDNLYLIPCNYHSVVHINMDNDLIYMVQVNFKGIGESICVGNAVKISDEIFFAYEAEKCMVVLNTVNRNICKIYPNNQLIKYTHIFNVEGKSWLIPYDINDGISIWDNNKNVIEEIISFPKNLMLENHKIEFEKFPDNIKKVALKSNLMRCFAKGYQINNEIHMLPHFLCPNIVINTSDKVIKSWESKLECSDEVLYTYNICIKMIAYIETEEGLYAISGITGEWFHYVDGEWIKIKRHIKIRNHIKDAIYLEGKLFEFNSEYSDLKKENCGEKIYKEL